MSSVKFQTIPSSTNLSIQRLQGLMTSLTPTNCLLHSEAFLANAKPVAMISLSAATLRSPPLAPWRESPWFRSPSERRQGKIGNFCEEYDLDRVYNPWPPPQFDGERRESEGKMLRAGMRESTWIPSESYHFSKQFDFLNRYSDLLSAHRFVAEYEAWVVDRLCWIRDSEEATPRQVASFLLECEEMRDFVVERYRRRFAGDVVLDSRNSGVLIEQTQKLIRRFQEYLRLGFDVFDSSGFLKRVKVEEGRPFQYRVAVEWVASEADTSFLEGEFKQVFDKPGKILNLLNLLRPGFGWRVEVGTFVSAQGFRLSSREAISELTELLRKPYALSCEPDEQLRMTLFLKPWVGEPQEWRHFLRENFWRSCLHAVPRESFAQDYTEEFEVRFHEAAEWLRGREWWQLSVEEFRAFREDLSRLLAELEIFAEVYAQFSREHRDWGLAPYFPELLGKAERFLYSVGHPVDFYPDEDSRLRWEELFQQWSRFLNFIEGHVPTLMGKEKSTTRQRGNAVLPPMEMGLLASSLDFPWLEVSAVAALIGLWMLWSRSPSPLSAQKPPQDSVPPVQGVGVSKRFCRFREAFHSRNPQARDEFGSYLDFFDQRVGTLKFFPADVVRFLGVFYEFYRLTRLLESQKKTLAAFSDLSLEEARLIEIQDQILSFANRLGPRLPESHDFQDDEGRIVKWLRQEDPQQPGTFHIEFQG